MKKITSKTKSIAGVDLAVNGRESESTMITRIKSITNFLAGWLLSVGSLDGDRITIAESGATNT